ncbi:MAG: response regulator transcription factor [Gammaproteobacteria bacterium]|nr:response regulator transcription factor [Gammaproteobacteria bacterium]
MMNILFLEDEPDLAEQIQHFLQKRGYVITLTSTLAETLQHLQNRQFNLLLLDRLVPDGDSVQHIADFKAHHNGPIVLLTALGQTINRIEGYQTGIDHYFAKPVDLDELHIVLQNLLTKFNSQHAESNPDWQIKQKVLYCPNLQTLALSSREALVLAFLMEHAGQILDKQTLLNALTIDDEEYDYRRMDSMLYRIRKKVAQVYEGSFPLETIHGLGYSWMRD